MRSIEKVPKMEIDKLGVKNELARGGEIYFENCEFKIILSF